MFQKKMNLTLVIPMLEDQIVLLKNQRIRMILLYLTRKMIGYLEYQKIFGICILEAISHFKNG